jgi:hypothetical protein
MRIVFSRKGYDSTSGGFPSFIFPDGTLFSVPIPTNSNHGLYSSLDFEYQGTPIQEILNQVTSKRIRTNGTFDGCDYAKSSQFCHHDPMYISSLNRLALGQTGASESHLRNQRIDEGDMFLFYGWFKKIDISDGNWGYVSDTPDIHLIWSSMIILKPLRLDTPKDVQMTVERFPQLAIHPHLSPDWSSKPNSIYLSEKHSMLPFAERRCLTDLSDYDGRAKWSLPVCFNHPEAFTYLNDFRPMGDKVAVSYRGYGQEFVLDLDKVPSYEDRQGILKYVDSLATP